MALVGLLLSSWLSVFAADCPVEKTLPALPVHDQDGLGTCASNTAALMMQHNLGLAKSPSYIQLSVTTSGLEHDNFYRNDDEGQRRLFNYGALVCNVVDQAKESGYCDYDQLGFDFVGSTDPRATQSRLLDRLSTFFDTHSADITALRNQLANPQTRADAERRLAYFFQHNEELCRTPLIESIAGRMLERHRATLESFVSSSTTTTAQKRAARSMLASMFSQSGAPNPNVLRRAMDFLTSNSGFEYNIEKAEQENSGASMPGVMNESTFLSWWAIPNDLNIDPLISLLPSGNFFLSDYRVQKACRNPEQIRSLDDFLVAPLCVLPPNAALSESSLNQAQQLLETVNQMAHGRLDRQAGLVNIISPSCAAQMTQREESFNQRCGNQNVSSAQTANRARDTMVAEICENRAVAISLCTGFFRSATPVNSNYCNEDTAGVEGHGRHAVTAIGYRRTSEGKRQIFIQNSWGASCPFLQHPGGFPATLQGLAECEMDGDNRPTGRFWVDEELLMNNTYIVNTLK
jgi:hypothetical protein